MKMTGVTFVRMDEGSFPAGLRGRHSRKAGKRSVMAQHWELTEEMTLLAHKVADGEASPAELERWAALLEDTPDLALLAQEIQGLGLAVQSSLRAQATQMDMTALQRGIMTRLEPETGTSTLMNRLRWLWAPLSAAALAALLVGALPRYLNPQDPATPPPDETPQQTAEVLEMDVPQGTAVVFQTPSNNLVIWLNRADADDAEDPPVPGGVQPSP